MLNTDLQSSFIVDMRMERILPCLRRPMRYSRVTVLSRNPIMIDVRLGYAPLGPKQEPCVLLWFSGKIRRISSHNICIRQKKSGVQKKPIGGSCK